MKWVWDNTYVYVNGTRYDKMNEVQEETILLKGRLAECRKNNFVANLLQYCYLHAHGYVLK